jgi:hypothetical protein
MTSIVHVVADLRNSLRKFDTALSQDRTRLSHLGIDCDGLGLKCTALLDSLEGSFDDRLVGRGVGTSGHWAAVAAKAKRAWKAERKKRLTVEGALAAERGDRFEGRIQLVWFVRVGLACPYTPARVLRDVMAEFGIQDGSCVVLVRSTAVSMRFAQRPEKCNSFWDFVRPAVDRKRDNRKTQRNDGRYPTRILGGHAMHFASL